MSIPFVGLAPARSSEHLAAFGVFCLLQLSAAISVLHKLLGHSPYQLKRALIALTAMFIYFKASYMKKLQYYKLLQII